MANEIYAIEAGADGCVIAGVEEIRGLFAAQRAEKRKHAEYYIGPAVVGWTISRIAIVLKRRMSAQGNRRDVAHRLLHARRRHWPIEPLIVSRLCMSSIACRATRTSCGFMQQVEDVTAIRARRFAELTISGAVPHLHDFH
jgi:hypothetical protein